VWEQYNILRERKRSDEKDVQVLKNKDWCSIYTSILEAASWGNARATTYTSELCLCEN